MDDGEEQPKNLKRIEKSIFTGFFCFALQMENFMK